MINWVKNKVAEEFKELKNAVLVPEGVRKARLSTCYGCDRFRRLLRQCRDCGCFVDVKTALDHVPPLKSKVACPLGKW